MPYNGSGTYVTVNPPPFVFNTIISETQMNAALTDIANALSAVLVRDGQAAMTGSLNMGSQAIHTLGAGTAGTPSLRFTAGNGFYLSGTNEVSLALGGAQIYKFTTTGLVGNLALAGDLTVTGRVVGANDTQTSYATGGLESRSSAGDVFIGLHAASVSAVSIKHARGGTGISVVDASGVNAPITASTGTFTTQPSFRAILGSSIASAGDITSWTEVHDVGSNFTPSTGVFVAPVAGTYLFSLTVQIYFNSSGSAFCSIETSTGFSGTGPGAVGGAGDRQIASAVVVMQLGAGVTVKGTLNSVSGGLNSVTGNEFSGYRLG